MKKVENWKSFYKLLVPESRQNSFLKKVYRKLFSIIAKNYWTAHFDGRKIIVEKKVNGFVLSKIFTKLEPNANWIKIPKRIHLNKLTCPSGLVIERPYSAKVAEAILLSDNSIELVDYNTLEDVMYDGKDVKEIYRNKRELRNNLIKANKKFFKRISFFSKTYLFVLKDILWLKKGQIIKESWSYNDYSDYRSNRSPEEVLKERYYTFFSLECNLNIDFSPYDEMSCIKQSFGCRNGCTTSCIAKDANNLRKKAYNIFIKLKSELKEVA